MTEEQMDEKLDRMGRQKREFDCLFELAQAYNRLPPVVDDDYPEARHEYEQKMRTFVEALEQNNRFGIPVSELSFNAFADANRARCESPQGFEKPVGHWSLSDWITATIGEFGEMANVAKKLNRIRDGIPGNGSLTEADLRQMLADEIADTFIYLDLLCQSEGLKLSEIVSSKFDETSRKIGYPEMLASRPD